MSELKHARADFEEYLGLKPARWKDGTNDGAYYDHIIENRWQDFLHGYTARRTQPEANADVPTDTEILDFVTREKLTIYLETERRKVPLTDGTFNYRYENVPIGWTLGVTSDTFDTPRDAIRAAIEAARQAKENGNG